MDKQVLCEINYILYGKLPVYLARFRNLKERHEQLHVHPDMKI